MICQILATQTHISTNFLITPANLIQSGIKLWFFWNRACRTKYKKIYYTQAQHFTFILWYLWSMPPSNCTLWVNSIKAGLVFSLTSEYAHQAFPVQLYRHWGSIDPKLFFIHMIFYVCGPTVSQHKHNTNIRLIPRLLPTREEGPGVHSLYICKIICTCIFYKNIYIL